MGFRFVYNIAVHLGVFSAIDETQKKENHAETNFFPCVFLSVFEELERLCKHPHSEGVAVI